MYQLGNQGNMSFQGNAGLDPISAGQHLPFAAVILSLRTKKRMNMWGSTGETRKLEEYTYSDPKTKDWGFFDISDTRTPSGVFCHKIKYVGTSMLFVDTYIFFLPPFFPFLFNLYSFHCRKCFLLCICIVLCTRRPLAEAAASSISDRTNNKNSGIILYMNNS